MGRCFGRWSVPIWGSKQNYLGEKIGRKGNRSRGANFTSADAIVRFRGRSGQIEVVLMDRYFPNWKLLRDELNRTPLGHMEWEY